MIQANELKVGNWVHSLGLDFKISKILTYSGKPKDYKVNLVGMWHEKIYQQKGFDKIDPILLDRIILSKLGFTKVPKRHRSDYDWIYEDKQIKGIVELSIGCYKGELHTFLWSGECLTHVKYVHQLQNLYFALTGEEIDVQLSEPKVE